MLSIKKQSVKSAYEYLVRYIMIEGNDIVTEDGQKCKEMMNVMVEITNPSDKTISDKYPLGKKAVENYTQQILYGTQNDFVYNYHDRLFDYRDLEGNNPTNQIKYIVKKLSEHPMSRRGVAITWLPQKDNYVKDVPCLQNIQFQLRDEGLYMTVLFRSNDLALAFHSNAIGLIELGEMVATHLNTKLVKYIHIANNMHIYHDRDKDFLKRF